jgi:hypothetical protein
LPLCESRHGAHQGEPGDSAGKKHAAGQETITRGRLQIVAVESRHGRCLLRAI